MFGSRHSCLEFRFRVGVRTLALHVLSHCVSVQLEFARPCALLSTCACACVLCEHMAFVLVFCVPCALMSIVLTPPILLPDYWLICPTCVYLITLLICSLYNLLVFAVPCQFVIDVTLDVSCSCPALSCQALPAVLFFPYGVVFVVFVLFLINKNPILLHH